MVHRIFTEAPLREPPVRYKVRTAETWEKARADYTAGRPAPAVCARYDIGLSALRQRARAEGWRRTDLDDPEPLDPNAPPPDPARMADEAWARVGQAVERGRVLEAQRWIKLARELRARAREVEEAERRRVWAEEQAALRAAAAAEAEPEPEDSPDDAPALQRTLALPREAVTTPEAREAVDWARFYRKEVMDHESMTWAQAERDFLEETDGFQPPAPPPEVHDVHDLHAENVVADEGAPPAPDEPDPALSD